MASRETWKYTGTLLHQDTRVLVLEARFRPPDLSFMGIVIRTGDRFIETYFTERWYNIFEIHDRDDNQLKGWYCNIGKPFVMESENEISYVDLALDLWVDPDGTQTILDEDEFAALDVDAQTKSKARAALRELQNLFSKNEEPGSSMRNQVPAFLRHYWRDGQKGVQEP
jgi:predicted RNA-binding protein associated with RNAse of E/G family